MSDKELFHGIFVPVFTPMLPNGDLNFEPISKYIDKLVSAGVQGIFLNGTSGEFFNLTLEERNSIAKEWLKYNEGRLKIILNIGASNLKDSQKLLKDAESFDTKADAYCVISPSYIPPATSSELIEYVKDVAKIAPQSKFFYYHIPMFTHCQVKLDEFLTSACAHIPNLIGIKFTDSDVNLLKRCRAIDNGKFIILVGNELLYHTGLALNCHGAILSTANFCPGLYKSMAKNATNEGTESESVGIDYFRLHRMFNTITESNSPVVSCLKHIAELCNLNVGKPRLPLKTMSGKEIETLKNSLNEIGFFDLVMRK